MVYFIRLMAIVVCLCASGEVVARKVPRGLNKALEKALFEIDSFTGKENSNETETLVTVANHEAKGL